MDDTRRLDVGTSLRRDLCFRGEETSYRSFRRVAIAIKQPIPLRRYVPSQDLTATEAAGKGLSVQKVARVCLRQRGTSPEKGAEMLAWTDIRKTGWDE